jgi:excisionase family DNA binding protein
MQFKNDTQPIVFDQQSAARALGVSVSTLRRWARDGNGPTVVKIGRLVRYRPADLDRFVRVQQRSTLAPNAVEPTKREQ